MVDWGAEAILATVSFAIGVFLTYGFMRERMKTKIFEESQRESLHMAENILEKEREKIKKEIEERYRERFEEWKRKEIEKREE